jgi:hypothetical protein
MAMKKILVRDDLRILGRLAVKELRRELIFQKHVATATLHDSINDKLVSTSTGLSMNVYAANYAFYVNSGRRKKEKRVPVEDLIKWVLVKGIANDDKTAKSIAFAIREKIYQEGTPTINSRRIASRRLRFIKIVKDNIRSEAREILKEHIQDNVRGQLNQWFRQAQKDINQ